MSVEILRDFSLGINFVEVVILMEIFLYFIMGYRNYKAEGGVPDSFTMVAAFGFLSGAIARSFYIVYDYYTLNDLHRYMAWIFIGLCVVLIFSSVFKGVTGEIFKDFPHKSLYIIIIVVSFTIIGISRLFSTTIFYIVAIIAGVIILFPLILRFNQWVKSVGGYVRKYFTIASFAIPPCYPPDLSRNL